MNRTQANTFALAGNATFTVTSRVSGTRFTYKVVKAEPREGDPTSRWFVRVLSGPNNETDYAYIGMVSHNPQYPAPRFFTRRGETPPPSAKAFDWTFHTAFMRDDAYERITVHHEGRCGRCGRKLTVPESVESGFGPECANKV
jgi:hypothetical protein